MLSLIDPATPLFSRFDQATMGPKPLLRRGPHCRAAMVTGHLILGEQNVPMRFGVSGHRGSSAPPRCLVRSRRTPASLAISSPAADSSTGPTPFLGPLRDV